MLKRSRLLSCKAPGFISLHEVLLITNHEVQRPLLDSFLNYNSNTGLLQNHFLFAKHMCLRKYLAINLKQLQSVKSMRFRHGGLSMFVIPAFRRLGQKNHEFEANLD
jgi:hypothetical protein